MRRAGFGIVDRSRPSLIEMARWKDEGHGPMGVSIFAHLAGAPEEKVLDAARVSEKAMLALLPGQ